MPQLAAIYVFCENETKHKQWTKEWKKVKNVFTQTETLCEALKADVRQSNYDLTSISIGSSSSATDRNELDQSFMYSQLLKEILLEGEYDVKEKKELTEFCRVFYQINEEELRVNNEFERDYPQPTPIWWYTRECFIYAMLNKALRTQDVQVIIKMGFFIRDLHRQIEQTHSKKNVHERLIVYRGQGMLNSEFEMITKSKGDLLSFNNFLSTSINRNISLGYARRARENNDLTEILFQMDIDPSISTTPFASLGDTSFFGGSEQETLFSMHTVFRIGEMKQIERRLFQVNLI